ncbi:signal peptide peptidase SppA [Duganella sp. CF458]|uniref:S49 family peptidase n=1 Tax=Duganella sp. CF458 TaxID=1884368 RepID=UPI0008EC47B4|nr:S49 family peptidase [Duganella sp. CF458]SFG29814.1 signal peptide peptidase SppA [Duganella sp. CF458]
MKLLDILTSAWAIQPEKLQEIQAIYAAHFRGEKIDIEAIEARLSRPLANEQQEYELREGGVAVLAIDGVIAPKANLFTRVSGGASAQMLTKQVESAIADPRVRSMVLAIDSPGGSVFGTPELAAAIHELSSVKPIVAVSEGTMASAAYWFGSAANAVFVSGPTVQVGSIGVVATHDYSPRAPGALTTEITAGRYKRIASSTAPLSEEGKAYMQAQVDHIYSVFVDAVAEHRGVKADDVLEHMADGRVFIGRQAIEAGLVDGVSTVDATVEKLASNPSQFSKRRKAVFALGGLSVAGAGDATGHDSTETVLSAGDAPNHTPTEKEISMPDPTISRESLERDHAALFAQMRSEFITAGATAERERILGIEAHSMPGHEALIAALKADGKTNPDQAAAQVLAAEKGKLKTTAAALAADAPAPVPAAAEPVPAAKPQAGDIAARASAIVAEAKTAGREVSFAAAAAQAARELAAQ